MRVKHVTMYYCDFCKKKLMVRPAMEKHEKHCTMNPNRACRMCAKIEADAAPLAELVAILPDPKDYMTEDEFGVSVGGTFGKDVDEAIPKLRAAADNCPMCMLAAIRQSGINRWGWANFNFKAEVDSVWSEYNADEERRHMGY